MKPQREQVLVQGLIAGLIAYATVVLFFVLLNLLGGRSIFHTAAALGSALFYGLQDPGQLVIEPGPVLAYNGLHLVLSLVVGMVAAWLVFQIERHHSIWYLVFFLFLAAFILGFTVVGVLGAEIAHILSWRSVIAANLAWALTMGGYLALKHASLIRDLRVEQSSAV